MAAESPDSGDSLRPVSSYSRTAMAGQAHNCMDSSSFEGRRRTCLVWWMLTCALAAGTSLGCNASVAQADEPSDVAPVRAFDEPPSVGSSARVEGEMRFGYQNADGSLVEMGRTVLPIDGPEAPEFDGTASDELAGVDAEPAVQPATIPPVITQEPEVSENFSCSRACSTVSLGGSTGAYYAARSCSSFIGAGGCNIHDGYAADVHLVDSFPTPDQEWLCRVYADTTSTFDLQVCCLDCVP